MISLSKKQNIDMTGGHLLKNVWAFSFPLMVANILQMLFNAADTIVVGRFVGQQALAAVGGTTSTLINLMVPPDLYACF